MERWLSLTLSERPARPLFLISIPKKIVRKAVRRNRIRRVLREALRQEPVSSPGAKTHVFKVLRSPENVSLHVAKQAIHELLRG
jgi:ribonuclease P protein component